MVLDHLTNWQRHGQWSHSFTTAFAFLARWEASSPDGKFEIDGDRVYATVMSYETKTPTDRKHEAHRSFADIQYLISGEEKLWYTPARYLGVGNGYNEVSDFEHFMAPRSTREFALFPHEFVVFFPGEGHRAGLPLVAPAPARKIVVKVWI